MFGSLLSPLPLCSRIHPFLGVCAHFMTFPLAICVKVEEYSMDIFISTCHISQKQVRLIETCQHSTTTSDTLFFFQNNTLQYFRNPSFIISDKTTG